MPPGGIGLGPLAKGGGGKGPGIEVGGLGGLPVGGAGGGPCGGGGGGAWGGGGNGLGGAPGAVVPLAAGGGGLFASGGFVLKYNCNCTFKHPTRKCDYGIKPESIMDLISR